MRIDVVTIFPGLFDPFFSSSLLGKAANKGLLELAAHDLRAWTSDKHKTTDDTPYGGGPGMVMKVEPFYGAVKALKKENRSAQVVLMSPQGALLNHNMAIELSQSDGLIILCGRYEGVDERVSQLLCDREISIGDYVVSGGETPAMVVIEAVCRLVPGVVGEALSIEQDSHAESLLEHPQYTRPPEFMGKKPPEILLSGDHKKIDFWRRQEAIKRTALRRPDLLDNASLTDEEQKFAKRIIDDNSNE